MSRYSTTAIPCLHRYSQSYPGYICTYTRSFHS